MGSLDNAQEQDGRRDEKLVLPGILPDRGQNSGFRLLTVDTLVFEDGPHSFDFLPGFLLHLLICFWLPLSPLWLGRNHFAVPNPHGNILLHFVLIVSVSLYFVLL
jgi:hypothetical protein